MFRVGLGFDVHAFAKDRDLYLGGVKIDSELGLLGHSDADVLLHAITDAVLGAACAGDIGELFPDNDPSYKNIRSTILLSRALEKVKAKGFIVVNCDAVIMCEQPKILPYREKIRESVANLLEIGIDCVMIKGKTTEKLGFTGRGEGMASQVVVLIRKSL